MRRLGTTQKLRQPRAPYIGLCVFLWGLTLSSNVFGAAVDRKVGVGFEQTLAGLSEASGSRTGSPEVSASGLTLQYWFRDIGLEAIFGGRAMIVANRPLGWATFLALGVHYNALRAPMVNLSIGLRFATGIARPLPSDTVTTAPVQIGFAVEVPLRAMFFLSDHFAISGAVGPVVTIGNSSGNPLTGLADTTTFSLFRGGFSGGLGFVVLFN